MDEPTLREALQRNPDENPTPLDRASFYVEELKYGPDSGKLEKVSAETLANEMDELLRRAKVESMSGRELIMASAYYGKSIGETFGLPGILAWSLWLDGLMHGIAFAGGIEGPPREARH